MEFTEDQIKELDYPKACSFCGTSLKNQPFGCLIQPQIRESIETEEKILVKGGCRNKNNFVLYFCRACYNELVSDFQTLCKKYDKSPNKT